MSKNRNNYMLVYMRDYRNGKRRGQKKGFYHTGTHRYVQLEPDRCPGCTILSPTICRMCEIEGVINGQSTRPFRLTLFALM